jgi:SHS2 domain-containing protein
LLRAASFSRGRIGEVRSVFRWVEHTGELELELESTTAEELFEEALAALAEVIGNDERRSGSTPTSHRSRAVEVQAGDRPALLAAWLDELVFLAEPEGFVPEGSRASSSVSSSCGRESAVGPASRHTSSRR